MTEPIVHNADFEEAVRTSFARQGLMAAFGAELTTVEPGAVEVAVPFRYELTQQQGFFHGGVTSAALETACGYAALTLMTPGSDVLTVEFDVKLSAPASGSRLIARGRVLDPGLTTVVCQGDVYVESDEGEVHCATMTATLMRVDASNPAG